jgi:rod shape-determining protein MreC
MEYVVNEEKLQGGEAVVTSGEDRIFPKDLLIGTVDSTAPGYPFQAIRVKPAARLDRLEDVIVLLSQQELLPKKAEEVSAPASGIVTLPNPPKPTAVPVPSSSAAAESKAPADQPSAPHN